jgi:hypothetical protein
MSKSKEPKAPALPKPDFNAKPPHPEDFAAWCEHPVTRFVAACYVKSAQKQGEHWLEASWGAGNPDAALLTELRARADAYNAFTETGLERYTDVFHQE